MKTRRTVKKVLAMVFAAAMFFTSLGSPLPGASSVEAASGDDATMHFIIQYWHAVDTNGNQFENVGDGCETLEGWIMPNGSTYKFKILWGGEEKTFDETSKPEGMMEDYSTNAGTVCLGVDPRTQSDGTKYETFSGFSVSAGHEAVKLDDQKGDLSTIEIQYNPNVHLVKCHVFYRNDNIFVSGEPSDAVSGGLFADEESGGRNEEHDTEIVYAYPDGTEKIISGESNTDISGTAIKGSDGKYYLTSDENGEASAQERVVEQINSGDIQVTVGETVYDTSNTGGGIWNKVSLNTLKYYSTEEGLHTDKTASVTSREGLAGDGRTFDLDLESWFVGNNTANVGMVLDASGSMAFTAEDIKGNIVTVNSEELSSVHRVDALSLTAQTEFDINCFLSKEQINSVLDNHNTDNSQLSYSDYTYYIYDPRDSTKEYVPLGYWDGSNATEIDVVDVAQTKFDTKLPQSGKLIGYYPFEEGTYSSNTTRRNWALNVITNEYATMVEQCDSEKISFQKLVESGATDENGKAVYDNNRVYFNKDYGYNTSYQKNGDLAAGLWLDAVPSSGNFTISFKTQKVEKSVNGDDLRDKTTSRDRTMDNMIYIGPMELEPESGGYVSVYRAASGSSNRLKAKNGGSDITNRNSVYGNTTAKYVTYVFEEGKITTYVDGTLGRELNPEGELDNLNSGSMKESSGPFNIILNGLKDDYNGASIYVDDIYIYDTALQENEVMNLYKNFQSEGKSGITTKTEQKKYFKVDGKIVGIFDDKYGVVEDSEGTGKNYDRAGWYYVSSSSDWYNYNMRLGTAKTYEGISTNVDYYYGGPSSTQTSSGYQSDDKAYKYHPRSEDSGPLKFFLDSDGKLCCFYTTGKTDKDCYGWSYVYEKKDDSPTKVETLQNALGMFVTRLEEMSPSSQVSAVRFSSKEIKEADYSQLVILDWTDDAQQSAGILNLSRGDDGVGTTSSSVPSSRKVEQYNYSLTGGTTTGTGLKAYQEYLANADVLDEVNGNKGTKYLIVFTDGKDTELESALKGQEQPIPKEAVKAAIEKTSAYTVAEELRDAGYTIFTVMMAAGSVKAGSPDYELALQFLATLSGEDYEQDKEKANSNAEFKYEKVYVSTDPSELAGIFKDEISGKIADDLNQYTVQDYIDPRFNLVDADGAVWKLENGGKVTVVGTDGSETGYDVSAMPTQIVLFKNGGDESKAFLCYDGKDGQNMYYLKWEDQKIPGCSKGASRLSVWKTKVTVQAKEDFIGGNAVMTNGNAALENYVYDPSVGSFSTDAASSGTGKMYRDEGSNPAKGFPRTTVNVKVPQLGMTGGEQVIFMGEELTSDGVADKLGGTINDWLSVEEKETPPKWYWRYLRRYAAYMVSKGETGGKDAETYFQELLNKIVTGKEREFDYFYIPDYVEGTTITQTGDPERHELDKLGTLTFTWVDQADEAGNNDSDVAAYPDEKITTDTELRRSALTVKYVPLTADGESENRVTYNKGTVQNEKESGASVYEWEPDRKPAAGDEQTFNKELLQASGTYTTQIVKGEIVLEMFIDGRTIEYLSKHVGGNEELAYSADLIRSYGGVSDQQVGTFTVSTTVSALADVWGNGTSESNNMARTEDGIYLYGTLDMDDTFGYDTSAEDSDHKGLPVGKYTLSPIEDEISAPDVFTFADSVQIVDVSKEGASISTQYPTYMALKETDNNYKEVFVNYAADLDETAIYLGGKKVNVSGTTEVKSPADTDDRYGLARISGSLDTGSLTISKEITLNGADNSDAAYDKDEEFTVKVEFIAPENVPLEPTFSSAEGSETPKCEWDVTSACATLTLKKNEKVTIRNLPLGTQVSVTEELGSPLDTRYTASYELAEPQTGETNESFEIGAEKGTGDDIPLTDRSVKITNDHKTASLFIIKEVKSDHPIKTDDDEYKLNVTLTYGSKDKPLTGEFSCERKDCVLPEADKITFDATGKAQVTLKAGGSLQIQGLPVGTKAVVTEKDNSENTYTYDVRYTIEGSEGSSERTSPAQVELNSAGAKGNVTVTNTPQTGSLTLSKEVDNVTTEEEFTFTVKLTKPDEPGEVLEGIFYYYEDRDTASPYKEISFDASGEATVTLQAGHSLTIVGLPQGTAYEVTEKDIDTSRYTVEPSEGVSSGTIGSGTAEVKFTNTHKLGSLKVTKEVVGKDNETREFSFTATLKPSEGVKLSTVSYTKTSGTSSDGTLSLTNNNDGTYTTAAFTLKDGESITFSDLPVGTQCQVEEKELYGGYTASIDPTSVMIKDGSTVELTVTNTYNPTEVVAALEVTKEVEGDLPQNKVFTFNLTADEENPEGVELPATTKMEITVNAATGKGSGKLDPITFTKTGTYRFKVTEEDGAQPGFTYDPAIWTWTVVVTDNDGVLEAASSYSKTENNGTGGSSEPGNILFTNKYKVEPAFYQPAVSKTVTGEDGLSRKDTFTFILTADENNPTGADLTAEKPLQITVDAAAGTGNGTGTFDEIKFTEAGTYVFYIKEDQTSPLLGYSYDSSVWKVTVPVTDIGGELQVGTVSYEKETKPGETQPGEPQPDTEAAFTNQYQSVSLTVSKKVEGIFGDTSKDFSFELNLFDSAGEPLTGEYPYGVGEWTETDNRVQNGSLKFSLQDGQSLTVKGLPSGASYTVKETLGEGDEDKYAVSVRIGENSYQPSALENEKQKLAEDTEVIFTNESPVPVGWTPKVKKAIEGYSAPQDIFKFKLSSAPENVDVYTQSQEGVYEKLAQDLEARVTGEGQGSFEELFFKEPGTYTFDVWEELPAEGSEPSEPAYTYEYDESHWTWTVTVKETNHVLSVTAVCEKVAEEETAGTTADMPEFINVYHPAPVSYTPGVSKEIREKILKGAPHEEVSFAFTLEEQDENPEKLPEDYDKRVEIPMEEGQLGPVTGSFGEITYTQAGTYCYTIAEEPSTAGGYTFDTSRWTLEVKVAEDVNHALQVTSHVYSKEGEKFTDENGAQFVNIYEAPNGSLTISKTVEEAPASGTSPAHEPNLQQTMKEVVGGVSGGNMQGGSVSGGNVPGSSVSSGNTQGGTIPGGSVSGGNVSGGNPQGSPYTIGVMVSGGSVSGGGEAQENSGSRLEGGNTLISQSMPKNILGETKIEEFEFEVVLSVLGVRSEDISGIYGDMEFVRGVATVKLAAGESKTATGLPAGITYTVRETSGGDYDVYHMEAQERKTGDTVEGSIPQGDTALAEFINVKKETPTEPTEPTEKPTEPTTNPTEPTEKPTNPTEEPAQPTEGPVNPTTEPTVNPSTEPTTGPVEEPTAEPTTVPTAEPTASPMPAPTATPTPAPTAASTPAPTPAPAPQKTPGPTPEATATPEPVVTPVPAPSPSPEPLRDPNLTYDENGDVVDANRQKKLPKTEDPMPLAGAALLAALSAGIMAVLSGRSLAASQGRRRKKK